MKLNNLVPPPISPLYAGNPEDWQIIEEIIEMPLPHDFKKLINEYGSGCFSDFLFLYSPFAPYITELNLLSGGTRQILSAYEEGQRAFPEYSPPFFAYPKRPGLFPCGKTINGDVLFWLTKGEPADWPVVICDSKFSEEFDVFEIRISEFLFRWLDGTLKPKVFPQNASIRTTFKSID